MARRRPVSPRRAHFRSAAPAESGWLQVNIALFPQGPGRPLFVPWADLRAAVEGWRAEARFDRCFFTRKEPGLRLRFAGSALDERLAPPLVGWLEEAERRNALRGFRFGLYEPETFRFGGEAGMVIAHDAFDRHTRLTLRYETLPPAEQATLPRRLFALLTVSDLFGRRVEDGAELWDIWRRLALAVGEPPPVLSSEADLDGAGAALAGSPDFLGSLPPAARTLLDDACADNAAIVARLRAAEALGRLTVGPRAWLAALTLFHWNRLGLPLPDLRAMVSHMLALLGADDDG